MNLENVLKNTNVNHNKHEDFISFTPRVRGDLFFRHNQNITLSPYIIGSKIHKPLIRLQVAYHGASWIFMNKISILCNDKKFEKSFGFFSGITRDMKGHSTVREIVDVVISDVELNILLGCKEGDDIRASGQYNSDKKFDKAQVIYFKEINFLRKEFEKKKYSDLVSIGTPYIEDN